MFFNQAELVRMHATGEYIIAEFMDVSSADQPGRTARTGGRQ
jgi:hypothetical protein